MPEYKNNNITRESDVDTTAAEPAAEGVTSLEKSESEESEESTESFHDQVEDLVNNTKQSNELKSSWGILGGIASGVNNLFTKKSRGQKLCQIFPAAKADDLKSVGTDETLVRSMLDKADGMGCLKCFDYLYPYITKVDIMEELIEERFGVPVGSKNVSMWRRSDAQSMVDSENSGENPRTEKEWTVNGLIHVYKVYQMLPQSDLDLAKCLMTFDTNQRKGSGAAYTWLNMYYVNYADDTSKDAFDPTNPINEANKFAPDNSYTRKNLVCIDMTTAHELGHIVDANAKGGRYSERFDSSGNPQENSIVAVSDWKRHYKANGVTKLYEDIKSCLDNAYALSGGEIDENLKPVVDLAGQKILQDRHYNDAEKRVDVLKAIAEKSVSTEDETELAEEIEKTAVIEHIIRAQRDNSPQSKELFSNMPTRQIHEDYLTNDWYSYSNNARKGKKISTYQFRNPGEEFAETYASYHVSDPKGSATPDGLKTWFENAGLDKSEEIEKQNA